MAPWIGVRRLPFAWRQNRFQKTFQRDGKMPCYRQP